MLSHQPFVCIGCLSSQAYVHKAGETGQLLRSLAYPNSCRSYLGYSRCTVHPTVGHSNHSKTTCFVMIYHYLCKSKPRFRTRDRDLVPLMYRAVWFSKFPVYMYATYKIQVFQLLLRAEYNGASPIAIAGFLSKVILFTVLVRLLNAIVL